MMPDDHYARTGTMFWKWALSPKNPRDDFLTVAAPDPTFTDIVVPGAKSALEFAKRSSPLQNCVKVGPNPCIHPFSRPVLICSAFLGKLHPCLSLCGISVASSRPALQDAVNWHLPVFLISTMVSKEYQTPSLTELQK